MLKRLALGLAMAMSLVAVVPLGAALPQHEQTAPPEGVFDFNIGPYRFFVPEKYVPGWVYNRIPYRRGMADVLEMRLSLADMWGVSGPPACSGGRCPNHVRIIATAHDDDVERQWRNGASSWRRVEGGEEYGLTAVYVRDRVGQGYATVFFAERASGGTFVRGSCGNAWLGAGWDLRDLIEGQSSCSFEFYWRPSLRGSLLFSSDHLRDWRRIHAEAAALIDSFIVSPRP